jgi:hypothetical protein
MESILDLPLAVFVLSLAAMWFATQIGVSFRNRVMPLQEGARQDLDHVIPAILTLLGLIIGFSFSMVSGHYDQRRKDEEEEANAIGTEYVRADLLPASEADRVHELLKEYLDRRLQFYQTSDEHQLGQINAQTAQLQNELWSVVQAAAGKQPTYPVALALSGMNDVFNSQGYAQAAWWYRLPVVAWIFMVAIAIFSSWLIGYSSHQLRMMLFPVLPLAVSISFFLIADIDSPRHGLIRVVPQNLISVSKSLHAKQGPEI